ncbi:MAG: hypothetical protein IIA60_01685 [Candidatus Marinimicrobia bacterium]|nr:hypothetical protein [Candidatus Neomarinimicrobiota bacterium]
MAAEAAEWIPSWADSGTDRTTSSSVWMSKPASLGAWEAALAFPGRLLPAVAPWTSGFPLAGGNPEPATVRR